MATGRATEYRIEHRPSRPVHHPYTSSAISPSPPISLAQARHTSMHRQKERETERQLPIRYFEYVQVADLELIERASTPDC